MIDVPGLVGAKPAGEGKWMARCPAHEDRTPSLSIREADGRWLVKCFAGCATDDVRLELGLTWGDLQGEHGWAPRRPWVRPPPRAPLPPNWMPAGAAGAFWGWLDTRGRSFGALTFWRGILVASIVGLDLARCIHPPGRVPTFARYGRRSWRATGHELVVPMFDATGQVRGFRARRITDRNDGAPKSLAPKGVSCASLVFADHSGRFLLETGRGRLCRDEGPVRVLVAEGEADFLAAAASRSATEAETLHVLGVVSGSWTGAVAARIPDGAVVVVATDHDEAGDHYADEIAQTLRGRCDVRRMA